MATMIDRETTFGTFLILWPYANIAEDEKEEEEEKELAFERVMEWPHSSS